MIGASSTNFCAQTAEETLNAVSKEFKLWEIVSEGEHYLPLISKRLCAIAPSYDLKYSIHAPISDNNIAALSERMREASTLELISTMEHAIELGVKTVTIHPGIYPMASRGLETRSVEKAKRSIRTLDRVTAEFGITMALENMPSFRFMLGRTANELKELLDGTNMKVCFDIGHANTMKETDNMIDLLGDRIVNMHVHDNHGSEDEHLTIGDGNTDYSRLGKMQYKGNHIIEARSLESAVISRDRLKKMFPKF